MDTFIKILSAVHVISLLIYTKNLNFPKIQDDGYILTSILSHLTFMAFSEFKLDLSSSGALEYVLKHFLWKQLMHQKLVMWMHRILTYLFGSKMANFLLLFEW